MEAVIIISDSQKDYYKMLLEEQLQNIHNCDTTSLYSKNDHSFQKITNEPNILHVKRFDFEIKEQQRLLSIIMQDGQEKINTINIKNVISELEHDNLKVVIVEHINGGTIIKNDFKDYEIQSFNHAPNDDIYNSLVKFLGKYLITFCQCDKEIINSKIKELALEVNFDSENIKTIFDCLFNPLLLQLYDKKRNVMNILLPLCFDMQGLIDTNFNIDYLYEIVNSYPDMNSELLNIESIVKENFEIQSMDENHLLKQPLNDLKNLFNVFNGSGESTSYYTFAMLQEIVQELASKNINEIKRKVKGINIIYKWALNLDNTLSRIIETIESGKRISLEKITDNLTS